jgi:hypothetical protein
MSHYLIFAVPILLFGLVFWLRKPGKGGAVGRRVRYSDWLAWRDAMDETHRKLEELRKVEPKL